MRAVSLFSGSGGFEIGFERAGIQTVLQAEQDPWCLEVLARHWPDVERVTDVRQVDAAALSRRCRDVVSVGAGSDAEWLRAARGRGLDASGVDLVYGGWPCQGNSVAGKRGGFGDARSGLWSEVRRVLTDIRPRWFVGENVPGLLSVNRGLDFCRVLMDLDELGYGVAWGTLDARFFGVPQRRRRVFIVGCLGNPAAAAAVLAVCESGGGHPAAGSEAGQGIADGVDGGVAFTLPSAHRGIGNGSNTNHVAASLSAGGHPGSNMPGRHHEDDVNLVIEPEGFSESGQGWWRDGVGTLRAEGENRPSRPSNLVIQPEARALTARASGYRMDGETENFVVDGQNAAAVDEVGSLGTGAAHGNRGFMVAGALRASDGHLRAGSHGAIPMAGGASGVRRLTPLECERLMGWPDDWSRRTSDGREIPDSHRYRLCGNGVVAPVAEWIGHRMVAVDRMLMASAA